VSCVRRSVSVVLTYVVAVCQERLSACQERLSVCQFITVLVLVRTCNLEIFGSFRLNVDRIQDDSGFHDAPGTYTGTALADNDIEADQDHKQTKSKRNPPVDTSQHQVIRRN
jgi:hypothetical protein